MSIKKLPDYMINRLKAGEVVERPASVLKELIENAIDAGATYLDVYINDGGKKSIVVQDNGTGIDTQDLDLVLERYATSKLFDEKDLTNIRTYGFRGEALSAIAEVSKLTIQTKTQNMPIGLQLVKKGEHMAHKKIATAFDHGTSVMVEDLFFNTPARQKFLKSSQTEYFYIYQLFTNFALVNHKIGFSLTKNDRQVFTLSPANDVMERIMNIYKKDREKKYKTIDFSDAQTRVFGVIGDVSLHFGSQENIKVFVNKRPVNDRIIKRAILDAYRRQLPSNTYPFAIIYCELDPKQVDVNVHPRKLEVKFLDPGSIFQLIKTQIKKSLGLEKTIIGEHKQEESHQSKEQDRTISSISSSNGYQQRVSEKLFMDAKDNKNNQPQVNHRSQMSSNTVQETIGENMHLVGQIWNSYIVLQDKQHIFYVDQHALAERILYEKLIKKAKKEGLKPEVLLQPITVKIGKDIPLDQKLAELNKLGFDMSMIADQKLIVYAIPQILVDLMIDFEIVLQKVVYCKQISFDIILEEVFATKACKASIKAGQKLAGVEMKQLIEDGYKHIDQMFVCQHGRPFFVKITKKNIDKLFDR